VRRSRFPWVIALILVLAWAGWHLAGLVLAGAGLGVIYLASLRVHPRIRHTGFRGCGGTGEHRGSVFTWTHRRCPGCDGGRLVRWGAGHYGAPHIQAEYRRNRTARAKRRQEHRWR
jgi:hypothetical protein